jgi:ATP-dependent DNA helicase RecQ
MKEGKTSFEVIDTLKRYFGYASFLPHQEEIVQDILAGKDVFALLPTGGGKSLCYQLPAVILDGVTIVISPLIALMKDQVDKLRAKGIPAAFINSTLDYYTVQETMSELLDNRIKLLYIAPERLALTEFVSFLKRLRVDLIAVDEAHCISEWGHEFRPAYRELKLLKEKFGRIPIIALTATAIPEVQMDIVDLLMLKSPSIYISSFNRKNLFYQVKPKVDTYGQLLQYLAGHRADSGIIYCLSQKATESLAARLQSEGFHALPYHAGLDHQLREETQNRFINNEIKIIVATIAFGMGVDKPDIRFVIHYDLPKSLETYCQETGRAGRDGRKSDCILFFSYGDIRKIEYLLDLGDDENRKHIAHRKLRDMVAFCESPHCRRKSLLGYFGEVIDEIGCDNCDNCLQARESIPGTDIARKILSCIVQMDEHFGASQIADVLRGSRNQKVINNGHDALKAFGTGKEYPKAQWMAFIRELTQLGCLSVAGDRYPILKLTSKGYDTLQGVVSISLTKPKQDMPATSKDSQKSFDEGLFQCLKDLRSRLAREENVPPYMIFHDSSLRDMAARIPRSRSELMDIYGVGEKKLEKYGDHFLKEIEGYCTRNDIDPRVVKECLESYFSKEEIRDTFFKDNRAMDPSLKADDVEDWFYEYNTWSFTKHKIWNECKRAYYYNYIAPALKQIPEELRQKLRALKSLESRFSLKGKLIHEAIEVHLSQRIPGSDTGKNRAKQYYAKNVNGFRKNAGSNITEYFNGDHIDASFFDRILEEGFLQIDLFFDNIMPEFDNLDYLQHEKFGSLPQSNLYILIA